MHLDADGVVFFDDDDVYFFKSFAAAERFLEPWQIPDDGRQAFTLDGRELRMERHPSASGIFMREDDIRVRILGDQRQAKPMLHAKLIQALRAHPKVDERVDFANLDLDDVVQIGLTTYGWMG